MINTSPIFRKQFFAVAVCAALFSAFSVGCGDKHQAKAPNAPSATSAVPAGPVQGKVSTGADPDKAPSYPNMYGKSAGPK